MDASSVLTTPRTTGRVLPPAEVGTDQEVATPIDRDTAEAVGSKVHMGSVVVVVRREEAHIPTVSHNIHQGAIMGAKRRMMVEAMGRREGSDHKRQRAWALSQCCIIDVMK